MFTILYNTACYCHCDVIPTALYLLERQCLDTLYIIILGLSKKAVKKIYTVFWAKYSIIQIKSYRAIRSDTYAFYRKTT